jgi:C4-dicarboxylate-specific signal transduction histidine kinase
VSWREALLTGFAWAGWALALAALWTLRRRLDRVADAEHELRGAVTAIALDGAASPPWQLQRDRMTAALADLATARGARPAPPADLEAGRFAQVLANVIANAAEHGIGPVEVRARNEGGVARLEVRNAEASDTSPGRGRGRGLLIARRAARELGGRVSVESKGGYTRTVVELPADPPDRRAA